MSNLEQSELAGLMRKLQPEQVRQILDFARFLADRYGQRPVDESDTWSEVDIAEYARASVDYANKTIPYDEDPAGK